ncbi:MAG: hypothetical protein ACRCV9_17640 [Burkholderiaceae bacterium]
MNTRIIWSAALLLAATTAHAADFSLHLGAHHLQRESRTAPAIGAQLQRGHFALELSAWRDRAHASQGGAYLHVHPLRLNTGWWALRLGGFAGVQTFGSVTTTTGGLACIGGRCFDVPPLVTGRTRDRFTAAGISTTWTPFGPTRPVFQLRVDQHRNFGASIGIGL